MLYFHRKFSSGITLRCIVNILLVLIALYCIVWNPWALIALCYSQDNIIIMNRISIISTSSGHMWTTKDSNLMTETEYTTLSQDTFIECFRDPVFMKPIHKETSKRLVQAILDRHPSICQNNPLLSQNNTQLSPSNIILLNNLPSHNLDPEPLPQTQNRNTTSNPSSNNQKCNNKPLNNTSTLKYCNQQTLPLQINKQLPRLLLTQQEFLDTEPLDH